MNTIHPRGSPVRAVLAGLAAGGLLTLGASAPAVPATAHAPAPPVASQERAIATVKPSVVLINIQWAGSVQMSGSGRWYGPYRANTSCSGATMSNDGYVVTAGHCTDPAQGRRHLIDAMLAQAVRNGFSQAKAEILRPLAYGNWKVEGSDGGSDPARVVGVYPTAAASGITVTTPMQAVVKQTVPFGQGDVALLKVEPQNGPLPAVAPAAQDPAEGQSVITTGYPASVGQVVDPGGGASYKPGSTSSLQTVSGAPFTEVNAETSAGMSGGPVVDYQGNLLGTVSFKPGTETQPFNFMTRTSMVRQLLTNNGVPTTLSATDRAYRTGLDDYFAGRYHSAVQNFDRVLTTMPSHQQAQLYKGRALSRYGLEDTGPGAPLYIAIGAAALLLIAGGVGMMLVVRRRRRSSTLVTAGAPVSPVSPAVPTYGGMASPRTGPAMPPGGSGPSVPVSVPPMPVDPASMDMPPARAGAGQVDDGHLPCPDCGTGHEPQARFCPGCGRPFTHPAVPKAVGPAVPGADRSAP